MKRPVKKDYAWVPGVGFQSWEGEYHYLKDMEAWRNRDRTSIGGRPRAEPIHPSWADYVAHFDPTNPERSQNAFCAWAGIRPSSLSAAKRKPIRQWYEVQISIWIEELQKLEAHEKQ